MMFHVKHKHSAHGNIKKNSPLKAALYADK